MIRRVVSVRGGLRSVVVPSSSTSISSAPSAVPRLLATPSRLLCSERVGLVEGVPETSKFEPDTPQSRRLYLATLAGVAGLLAYCGIYVYNGQFSNQAKKDAKAAVKAIPLIKGNPVVFIDLAVDGGKPRRMVFQLRKDVVPRTAENFRALCTGERGFGYRASRIHAILPGSYVAGGDFLRGTGEAGYSIYGDTFDDENHDLHHIGPGTLSMTSRGPDTNNSQFFVALQRAQQQDGRHVVVGNMIEGWDVLESLENHGNWRGDVSADIRIVRCGQLVLDGSDSSPAPAPESDTPESPAE